jgi:gamma-glutamyltranspeptidase/glutathione hydrolase
VPQLLYKKYGEAWRASVNPGRASSSQELKRPAFGELERYAAHRPSQAMTEPQHTTHYSVVDAAGNAASVTTTLNDSFGSRVTATGLGFLLNDEMDDFSSKPGVPNMFGLIQGPANAIGPQKRPLSAMTPTMVVKDGKLALVLGSPGGPRIITTVTNILLGVVDYGLNLQEAVNAPRFHHQWLPDTIYVEKGVEPETVRQLEHMGHKVTQEDYWSDGECIAIDAKTGERLGATDVRNAAGEAVGY